jgi:hypothetical protein
MIDELRMESVNVAFRKSEYLFPVKTKLRLYSEHERIEVMPKVSCRYLYTEHSIDDLISLEYNFDCEGNDPLGFFSTVNFQGNLIVRGYTGRLHHVAPIIQDDEEKTVYIFPEWGNRYHQATCTYIKGSCHMVYLTKEITKDYKPCEICNAQSAQPGNPVFCFFRYGKVYHLGVCRQVERYYIEINKSKAEQQGYTPCSKCGG